MEKGIEGQFNVKRFELIVLIHTEITNGGRGIIPAQLIILCRPSSAVLDT